MISYAQNHEDVVLNRLFPADHVGFYIDIGANHPSDCSVTKHFYDRGWTGINVEPGHVFEVLNRERPGDTNLNLAVSDHNGRNLFHEYPTHPGLSTLDDRTANASHLEDIACLPREVEVITLRALCERYVKRRTVDFMSIDVEGHEEAVIRSGDWDRFRPRVLIIEATKPTSRTPAYIEWEPILLSHQYHFGLFDGLNRFYVRDEDRDFLPLIEAPACIFDDFIPFRYLLPREQLETSSLAARRRIARLLRRASRRAPWLAKPVRQLLSFVVKRRAS
jgi:FkbM family methyltransferase